MVFPADCTELDKDRKPLVGQVKGMEWVLQEHGLLQEMVKNSKNGKVVAVCKKCKQSQEAHEKAAKEAKACQDEIEGLGVQQFSERSECEEAVEDLDRPTDCCMQHVLSLQPDFQCEKPLLQLLIEKAGHKCLFLLKFHCKLNPIEMVWGQAKCCMFSWSIKSRCCLPSHRIL